MSKKISQMTPTGVAPATSELALAYNGENYKINPADILGPAPSGVELLNGAGNSIGYLTGIAQSPSATDPVEFRGINGSFWACGCDPT